jgi:hypothetical protein
MCGAVPLLAFLVEAPAMFHLSVVMTALASFPIGCGLKAECAAAAR